MSSMRSLCLALLSLLILAVPARSEVANCTAITTLPRVITQPGIYCLKQDLATAMTTGNAITINANSVTIELNGFKLGGLGAGPSTQANGIYALNRQNITIRNGTVRGFRVGLRLENSTTPATSSGHVIEDMRIESSRYAGIVMSGSNSIIRRNAIVKTGGGPAEAFSVGIDIVSGSALTVADKVIMDIVLPSGGLAEGVVGIWSRTSKAVSITKNEVKNVGGFNSFGIVSDTNSNHSAISENIIMNDVSGFNAIYVGDSSTYCGSNIVVNFSRSASGC